MLISNILEKIFKILNFFWEDNDFSLLATDVSKQNTLIKNMFGHGSFICQPISKSLVSHFTANLDLDIGKKMFRLPPNR